MADDLCGPSNALQNFQKHSSVDRTLQQDRLARRPSPSQGFRSASTPTALIDHEFESFQAGHLSLESQNYSPRSFHTPTPPQHAAPSWANDFQQLNISGPQQARFQQQGLHSQSPQQQHGGWYQNSATAHSYSGQASIANGKQPAVQMGGPSNLSPQYYNWSHRVPGIHMQQNQFSPMRVNQSYAPQVQAQQHNEVFDDEAFARAFDKAAKEAEGSGVVREQVLGQGQGQNEILLDESAERFLQEGNQSVGDRGFPKEGTGTEDWKVHNQMPLGADTIQAPSNDSAKEEPDALSRTAGQLLDRVRHDQSDKFKKSRFLQLMRHFRDGEVVVEGDRLVGGEGGEGGSTGERGMDMGMGVDAGGSGREAKYKRNGFEHGRYDSATLERDGFEVLKTMNNVEENKRFIRYLESLSDGTASIDYGRWYRNLSSSCVGPHRNLSVMDDREKEWEREREEREREREKERRRLEEAHVGLASGVLGPRLWGKEIQEGGGVKGEGGGREGGDGKRIGE